MAVKAVASGGVVLKGIKSHRPVALDCETLEEAVRSALWAIQENQMSPHRIETPSGRLIMDRAGLDDAMVAFADRHDQ